jgi:hypothetical protein
MSKKGKSQVRLFLCVTSGKSLDGFGDSDVVVKISETKSKKKIGKSGKSPSNNPTWNYLCSMCVLHWFVPLVASELIN